jgi:hypothetical protein
VKIPDRDAAESLFTPDPAARTQPRSFEPNPNSPWLDFFIGSPLCPALKRRQSHAAEQPKRAVVAADFHGWTQIKINFSGLSLWVGGGSG